MTLPKPWDIEWPLTPETIEAINSNFEAIFKRLQAKERQLAALEARPGSAGISLPVSEANGGTGETAYDVGDLLGGDGTGLTKLPVGADGEVLTAHSSEAVGMKWAPLPDAGDVDGPAGAVDGHLAVFDGASGKKVKDGGPVPAGGSGRAYEPLTNSDPAAPELVFFDGDVVMVSML